MAKARAIVKRRKAVRNIKKITKTMQMIATAKFQKSLKRAVGTKPYTNKVRELVRELASEFRTRIEMRQIGVRDEAKILGGYGTCGRPLCCTTFLTAFEPVSIKMAKQQDLSLNPSKLSGLCGRLKCCLRYELPNAKGVVHGGCGSEGGCDNPSGCGSGGGSCGSCGCHS